MTELNYIIAHNINALRAANGMKQVDLAQQLNYTDKLISKWERGEAIPNAQSLWQLSEIFGVSMDYLFTDHRDSAQPPKQQTQSPAQRDQSKQLITLISICGIWFAALVTFILLWILKRPYISIFAYALTATLITMLVFSYVWHSSRRYQFSIIAGLLVSIALTVYVALFRFNCWQIFLLLLPGECLVFLCERLTKIHR